MSMYGGWPKGVVFVRDYMNFKPKHPYRSRWKDALEKSRDRTKSKNKSIAARAWAKVAYFKRLLKEFPYVQRGRPKGSKNKNKGKKNKKKSASKAPIAVAVFGPPTKRNRFANNNNKSSSVAVAAAAAAPPPPPSSKLSSSSSSSSKGTVQVKVSSLSTAAPATTVSKTISKPIAKVSTVQTGPAPPTLAVPKSTNMNVAVRRSTRIRKPKRIPGFIYTKP